jgi:hypothetical protein
MSLLKKLSHPNVLKFIGLYYREDKVVGSLEKTGLEDMNLDCTLVAPSS